MRSASLVSIYLILVCCFGCTSLQKTSSATREPAAATSGNTYYVDRASGDDNNNGLNSNSAWKTLSKINNSKFHSGDSILFKRGQVWDESLRISNSGAPSAPITLSAYGEGPRPVFTGAMDVVNKTWVQVRPRIWATSLPADEGRKPERIFIDGKPLPDRLTKSSAIDLNQEREWAWESMNGGMLYLYGHTPPSTWGNRVEVNFRRRGIMLGAKKFIHIKEIDVMRFREGLWMSGSDNVIENFTANENSFSGITIIGSSNRLRNIETSFNGIDMAPGDSDAHGLGILIDGFENQKGSDNEISDFTANENSEDGVQTGPSAGNGNRFINAKMRGNRENCFDIKNGDQIIIGGEVKSDAESSADCILVHKVPHKVMIQGIRASATTKGPALHVMQGASVEAKNVWLEADESSAMLIGESAGDETKLLDSKVDGGGKKSGFLIDVRSANRHLIRGNILNLTPGTQAFRIAPDATATFESNKIVER